MENKKEKTAFNPSVGADERQPIQKNAENSISEYEENIKSFEEMQREMQLSLDYSYLKAVSMNELFDTQYQSKPPLIDGLLYPGTYIFAGSPKLGKSFLMAQLAYHVSTGRPLWNYTTRKGTVLYLALEDDYRRLQERLYRMFGTESADNLFFSVSASQLGKGLDEQLARFVAEHTDTKLIIIDTLQKVRDSKGSTGKTGMYGNDYDDISTIKKIADERDISIILVHHLRKLKDGDDPFNEVSGSTGITGAADTNYVLKRKRSSRDATLLACGRDVEYQELTLRFQDLKWGLVEHKNTEEIRKEEIPQFLFRVAEFMKDRNEWVGTATELIADMEETETTPNVVTKYLGQFYYEVLEPAGIEYRTKRTGQNRLIKFIRRDGDDANDGNITV